MVICCGIHVRGWPCRYAVVSVFTVALPLLFTLPISRALTNRVATMTTTISPPKNNAQMLLLARQIKSSGTNIAKSLELLQGLTNVSIWENHHMENRAIHNFEQYEAVYFEVLSVVSRANRKNHQSNGAVSNPSFLSQEYIQQVALLLYEQCPTDPCRARTISICNHGSTDQVAMAHRLLHSGVQPPSIQSYHAVLSICVTAKDWKQALHLVQNEMASCATTLSWNIVFTALTKAKEGRAALHLLRQMIQHHETHPSCINNTFPPPDRNTFHLTMNALIAVVDSGMSQSTSDIEVAAESNVDTAYNLLNSMISLDQWYASNPQQYSNISVRPNDATFDLLVSAYGRSGDWDKVKFLSHVHKKYQDFIQGSFTFPDLPTKQGHDKLSWDPLDSNSFSALRLRWEKEGMIKRTNEKFWKIGTFSDPMVPFDFTVALQPNRNPSKNGIKLLLYAKSDSPANFTKVGYLIMINRLENSETTCTETSTFLGMYLDPLFRQCGLSKIMIAIWLALCHHANAVPRTGVMNKPLLALVLQHTFQFLPEVHTRSSMQSASAGGGVSVEISPGVNASIGLYSSNIKCLQGAFSVRDIKRENIVFLTEPSTPRGRVCRIGTTFIKQPAIKNSRQMIGTVEAYDEIVKEQLLGKTRTGSLKFDRPDLCWRQVFFGDNTDQSTNL